jgi:cell wall assembly regulator SMI1
LFKPLTTGVHVSALLSRLDQWLAKNRSRFRKNLLPGASAADIAGLGKSLGKPVPAGLAALLSWHNGQGDEYVGYFVDHWLFMSAAKIAAAKADLDAVGGDYGWKTDWLPFLDDDGGNFVVLDLSNTNLPVLAYWMGEKAEHLAPSLEAWLNDFVSAVEAGRFSEDPERGTFSKSNAKK